MKKNYYLLALMLLGIFVSDIVAQTQWDNVPEEIRSRNSFKRLEHFYRQRSAPFDTVDVYKYVAERKKEIAKRSARGTSEMTWSPIGPIGINSSWPEHWGVSSGRVKAIGIHPSDPGIVYIGAAAGGIWKTTNGGESWLDVGADLASLTFGSIAIDPVNPEIVYAGSGEALGGYSSNIFEGRGLYKTTDGGDTWTNIIDGFGIKTHIASIAIDPENPSILLAGLTGGNAFLGNPGNTGLWRSTDAGETWTRIIANTNIFDVVFKPGDAQTVFASGNSFYVSTNKGESWSFSSNGMPNADRMQISVSESNPEIVYAYLYAGGSAAYKSTNGGSSWSRISSNKVLGGSYDGGDTWYDQGWYDLCIAVNPADPDDVMVGNVELHRTANGSDFNPVRIPGGYGAWDSPMHVDYHVIRYAPSDPDIIYIGCDGGVNKSTDGGNTWFNVNNGISTIQFYAMASHPTDPNKIIGGAQDNGNYITTDRGATNYDLTTTGDGMNCFFDHTNPSRVYMSTQYGSIYRNSNGGVNGDFYNIEPNYESNPTWTAPFWMHPENNETIYVASRRLWKSTNAGNSWQKLTPFLTSRSITSVSQSSVDPSVMILVAASYSSGNTILVTNDEWATYSDVSNNIPGQQRYISSVKTDPFDANTLYIVRSGYSSGKVYKTTDLGETWTDISSDLPDVPHNDILIDPIIPGNIYAANDLGVYQTTDGGTSWNRAGEGLPMVVTMDLDYAQYGNERYLRAGTHGRSAYEMLLDDSSNPFLLLARPAEGDEWVHGSKEDITWYSNLTGTIDIEYSTDEGATWEVIAEDVTARDGKYSWTLPGTYSSDCMVRLTDENGELVASNTGKFSIIPLAKPQMLTPAEDEGGIEIPVVFTWSKSKGASFQNIQVYDDTTATFALLDTLVSGSAEMLQLDGLEKGSKYYWRMSALNDSVSTGLTPFRSFKTIFAAPLLTEPENLASDVSLNPVLKWQKVNETAKYRVQVSKSSTFLATDKDTVVSVPELQLRDLANNKNYYWKVAVVDEDAEGLFSDYWKFTTEPITGIDEEKPVVPGDYAVSQNYPNPFNPSTLIEYALPEASEVTVEVYNMLGQKIDQLFSGVKGNGYHSVSWNASGFASGTYVIRVTARSQESAKKFSENVKVILMK